MGFLFVGLPLPCSPCDLASFVCPGWPLAALWWLLPPPPPSPLWRAVFVAWCSFFWFIFSLFRSLVVPAPAVSGFLWFPASGALGLGALCCLFCWPPSSRLAVRFRLFCVSRLAVGCSLVVAVPPPLSCHAVFIAPSRSQFFISFLFFSCAPPCLWLSLVPGPRCPGPWRCVLSFLLASRFSSRCALSPLLCFPPGHWLLTGGCCPPPPSPFVSRGLSVLGFFFHCTPPLSHLYSGFRPRVPWALALCVVCFPRGRLWRPAFCFVLRPVVWCCSLWCVLCCAWCCVACLCLVGFLRRVVVGLVVLFLLCFAVVLCCVLCWFFLFFFPRSLVFPWCSVLFQFLCFACALRCLCVCGVALCALLSCPRCPGWCFVLLSVVFACLLLGLAVLCGLLLGPAGSWCHVCVMCCGVSLGALLRVVPPGVALLCPVLFRFALLGAVARCVLSWVAVRRPVGLCLRRCVLSCLAALCVFCCGVLLPVVVLCAVCVLGCPAMRSLASPPCAVLLCFPAFPWCPALLCCAPWCCAAVWCCGLLSCCLVCLVSPTCKSAAKLVFNQNEFFKIK